MSKSLVVYYSYSDTTRGLAEDIALFTDADIRDILNGNNIDEGFVMFINKPSNRDFKMVEKYQNESEKYEEFLSIIEKNILDYKAESVHRQAPSISL